MRLDFTTILSSGFVATIIGIFNLVGQRYTNRILDQIEHKIGINNSKDDKS
jgi:hypothetical protein